MLKLDYTRAELIQAIENAIQQVDDWSNRDDPYLHVRLGQCWALLKAGCEYEIKLPDPNDPLKDCVTHEGTVWLDIKFPRFESEAATADLYWIPLPDSKCLDYTKKKKVIKQKFGDMHYGQWFKECGGDRRFIKMQHILPSGITVSYQTVSKDDQECGGNVIPKGKMIHPELNAVDIDGIPGRCPDWLEFELIDPPFPQRVKH